MKILLNKKIYKNCYILTYCCASKKQQKPQWKVIIIFLREVYSNNRSSPQPHI